MTAEVKELLGRIHWPRASRIVELDPRPPPAAAGCFLVTVTETGELTRRCCEGEITMDLDAAKDPNASLTVSLEPDLIETLSRLFQVLPDELRTSASPYVALGTRSCVQTRP
jgi:hypothetical protein